MKRTVSLKLKPSVEQADRLMALVDAFSFACNAVVPFVVESGGHNRVGLHPLAYYAVREKIPSIGSQMVCNAIKRVADMYKVLKSNGGIKKDKPIKRIIFSAKSVHYDKRTYSIKRDALSLFTLDGRILVQFMGGQHQSLLLSRGAPKEAELIFKKGKWFFNLVLDLPEHEPAGGDRVLGVDVGENNLAATSSGGVFGGGSLRHNRDKFLALRRRLQSNGSKASKKRLRIISGREQKHVKHVNHETSKEIVQEAIRQKAGIVAMEDLTHIRDNIKAGKRVRTRLHRWAFRQLQDFVAYKAQGLGLSVVFVDPAYTSQTCSECHCLGKREKHIFKCSCGARRHADVNAAANIAWLAMPIGNAKAAVNQPNGDMLACSNFSHMAKPYVQEKATPL